MMPAQVVSACVTMGADAGAQALQFVDQLLVRHRVEIVVHRFLLVAVRQRARCPSDAASKDPARRYNTTSPAGRMVLIVFAG